MCYNVILAQGDLKMERQQVNIRLPKIITDGVEKQASMLGISRNQVYIMILYEYLTMRGLIDVKREG